MFAAFHQGLEVADTNAEPRGNLIHYFPSHHRIAYMCDTRGQFTGYLHFIGKGIQIAGCSFLLNPIIKKFRRIRDQFIEFLPAGLSHQ